MKSTSSLKPYNTFAIDHACMGLHRVSDKASLIEICMTLHTQELPLLILGGGSNIVLVDDFQGHVVKIQTKGIKLEEDETHFYLQVEAGENWQQLVEFCVNKQIGGLENLALIPGTVGAAPIQNIGAYGVEFKDICDWVEYLDLDSGQVVQLRANECQFAYRESIFKGKLKGKAVITSVRIKLPKDWQPLLSYGPLSSILADDLTPKAIFDFICQLRRDKLPDPQRLGNAGSFFKNPVVSMAKYQALQTQFPDLVAFKQQGGWMKLAAAWLIDKAGLKGLRCGDAGVHDKQALVLVNHGQASGQEVCQLANEIIDRVVHVFGIKLEPEPRLIGARGEIN